MSIGIISSIDPVTRIRKAELLPRSRRFSVPFRRRNQGSQCSPSAKRCRAQSDAPMFVKIQF